jgi:small subunit ribosomal protein S11
VAKKKKKQKKENRMKGKGVKERSRKKSKKRTVRKGKAYVKSTYNNTMITITDLEGNTLAWSSPGVIGFKGSRKSTAFAATKAAEDVAAKTEKFGLKEVSVIIKGTGMGRQAAVKGLHSAGIKITQLSDHTPIPHGGTWPRKKPRK